jgi:methyl-accepting chemotaxis protein
VLKAYSRKPRKLDKATNAIHRLNLLETEIVVASMGQVRAGLEKKRVDEQAKLFREQVGATVDAITQQSRSLSKKTHNMRDQSLRVRDWSAQVSTAGGQTAFAMVEASNMLGRLTDTADRALIGARQNTTTANDAVTKVNETVQTVNELQEKGRAMDAMLEMIRVIAKKTNLLALNVTVEAARIGDAGRTFAVIAQEVKNLAVQSSNVTEEVAMQIADVHRSTAQTVDSIGDLNKMMIDVGTNATNIQQSLDEQSSSILVISSAVDETSVSANLVSNNMEDVRQASELLTKDAQEIDNAYRNVDHQLNLLKQRASEFLQQITQSEADSREESRVLRAA